ncbi:hypothetical protein [Nonomuraea endophytica]|uniref:hypothetical protein n=1 Tax=Nonomuraea endophytica TaxID=714136 RepID=UPI0037C99A2B
MAIDRSDEPEPAEPSRREAREEPVNEDRGALYTRLWEAADRQEFGVAMDRLRNEVQPKLREMVEETRDTVPGAALVGLEFELKGEERSWDKVDTMMRTRPEMSPVDAVARIPDGVRYTFQFDAQDYAQGHDQVCELYKQRGYELEYRWNAWEHAEYKGINTRWRSPDGDLFEVQFHTPESFAAKQATHGAYEQIRDPATGHAERTRLHSYQREVAGSVPIPEDVREIEDYEKG